MAGNQLLTSQIVVDRAMAVLSETPSFLNMINTQYSDEFKGSGTTGKNGDTVLVRVPQRAEVRNGRVMDIQPIINKTVPVKIDSYKGVDTGATSAQMALQIDDFQREYIDTKIPDLITAVEADIINRVVPQVPATVGDYGPLDDARTVLLAGAYLDSQLAPKNDRNFMVNTYSQVDIVTALQGYFNSQSKIDRQYRKGAMYTDTLGFDWFSSNLTAGVTRGTANAGYLTNGVPADGSSTLAVDGGTGTLNIGDTFTIAGVYDVHPQTKAVLAGLKQFTVTTPYAGGAGTLSIMPALQFSGSERNISALPADNAAIAVKGVAGSNYAQNVAFSKDAFYMVTADLPNPPKSYGVDSASRTFNGITLRFQNGYDQINDMWLNRFDIVYGAGILRPELAVRIPATVNGI
ncbi:MULTISPECIES: P22 phage major capsid protein family protein [Xanthomonas]|uniref:Uncharacterized protein n=2 Tax=Xanthomonas TaxID=338 RepID=A0A7Z7J0W5_XANCH|nr:MULTISPECIES: P22 phage major capsid protein family protein [Xanthomonas]ATS39255.1 hypothetical protein XcfCFBP6988P_14930 [Xanthomonas citri pv. phaseoli var. fuscans]ATS41938.1 hypothetical protein XcfCFBP6989P_05560 [Xanthomonas citri pv. phaseoli var. fuscans]ATS47258.1 hypothetical protein XcfCFBP6990P_11800 [Xanthomonas citri pv. phaseoli var. fuscans]ATS86363.1 hypothetical protein XcfCFBP6991P_22430 [Xanthomonas citri pv. phaseoli var. fuscans]QWN20900.1 hypothetical protein DGM98_